MLKNLGFNLEQFQQNMNLLLIGESFAPIKKLKILNNRFSFSREHCKTTLFLDAEQNVEHIFIHIKSINSGFVYVLPAMIAQATQPVTLQHHILVEIMTLLMDLDSCNLSLTKSIVVENTKYLASWDTDQNYNLHIYPFEEMST